MNELADHERPRSEDPDFWDVWTGKDANNETVERNVDWKNICDDWKQTSGQLSSTDAVCVAADHKENDDNSDF
jgi:hypothetical protein